MKFKMTVSSNCGVLHVIKSATRFNQTQKFQYAMKVKFLLRCFLLNLFRKNTSIGVFAWEGEVRQTVNNSKCVVLEIFKVGSHRLRHHSVFLLSLSGFPFDSVQTESRFAGRQQCMTTPAKRDCTSSALSLAVVASVLRLIARPWNVNNKSKSRMFNMELEESIIITLVRQHEHLHNTSTRSYRNHAISGTIPDTVQRPIRNEYSIVWRNHRSPKTCRIRQR